jgi:hypothetical protein
MILLQLSHGSGIHGPNGVIKKNQRFTKHSAYKKKDQEREI